MTEQTQNPNNHFLGIALQLPTSQLMLNILSSLDIPFRNSAHDGYAPHQVIDVTNGYLEFYSQQHGDALPILIIEVENIEDSLAFLPKGFQVSYNGKTDIEVYSYVAICDYPQRIQLKLYKK